MTTLHCKFILITLLLALSSCTTAPTTTAISQQRQHSEEFCRVTVLPFGNDTNEPRLGIIAKKVCQSELLQRGAHVVNEADVRVFLQKRRTFSSQLTDHGSNELYRALAKELKTQGIIKGRILSIGEQKKQGETLPVFTLQLELLNAASGQLIASSFLHRSGEDYRTIMHYGAVRTQSELIKNIIAEIINDWISRGVMNCQKLS